MDYLTRVWAYHAGWLARIAPPTAPPEAEEDPDRRRLHRELGVEWLRTRVAAELAPLVWAPLDGDRARIATIVDDVVSAWLARGPEDRRELNGYGGFVDGYYSRVYFAKETDGEEVRWAQFCPPEGESVDEDAYARTVWHHHLDTLAGARR